MEGCYYLQRRIRRRRNEGGERRSLVRS